MTIGVAILGSTGSIGASALRVIARHADRFVPVALTAHTNAPALRAQASLWQPEFVGLVAGAPSRSEWPVAYDASHHSDLNAAPDDLWHHGAQCLVEAATMPSADIVLNAVVGAAGLPATVAALKAGKRVALANKETLVIAGDLVTQIARDHGGTLVPVDSEHSAILQCLAGRDMHEVRRLVLTASGGPFRTWSADRIADATVADALNHPTWQMGNKITVDSASLANKALEVIEAHHLFGVPYDRIDVVVHPQSIVHSFVEFIDGSVMAQLGMPSMELPILFAFTWPARIHDDGVPAFDPAAFGALTFEAVRSAEFPMLALGIAAGRRGGAAPAVFNAANESAVALFLDGRIRFGEISVLVDGALQHCASDHTNSLESRWSADAAAREYVSAQCSSGIPREPSPQHE